MKVFPVASPAAIKQAPSPDLKSRAVAAFNGQQAQQTPHSAQLNQNAISPEDMGAIVAPKQEPEEEVQEEQALEASEVGQTDTVVETAPEPKAEDPALSRQFAQLARQEKQLRLKAQQQDQQLKAREAALAAREAEIAAKSSTYDTDYIPKSRFKQDALSALEEAGLSYDEITQQVINQGQRDPRTDAMISRLEAKIVALEEQNSNSAKAMSTQQQQQYDAAVAQIRTDAKKLVFTDPNFETIKATNSVSDVVDLITQTYDKDGILLSVEEAANEVENYLTEEALKLTRIEKIKKRMNQVAPDSKASGQKTQSTQKQPQPTMKTLTNATSSTRQLSAKERAILAFKGEKFK